VLVINGDVNLDGNVYIKGDESPTGTDADTGKEYAGQTGLLVNGTLNISEGSTLAVYGGGHYMTTSLGGSAVKINNGAITGAGSLVAIGGSGSKEGGDAISGTGTISTANVFAQGGNSVYKDGTAGSAIASTVAISNATNRSLTDGTVGGGFDVDNYWGDITSVPDLALYTVEANAPGDAGDDGSLDKDSDPGKGDENGDADNDPESSKGDTLDTGKLPTGSTTTIIKTTKITKESAKLSPNTGETFPVAMVGFMLVMAAIMALMIGLLSLKKNIINRG
jgi:hypothetical protein